MAKSSTKNQKSENPTQSSGLKNAILFFPIIAIIGIIWLILIKLGRLPEDLTFGLEFNTWLNFWMVIFVIFIVILICIPQKGESAKTPAVEVTGSEVKKKVKKPSKAKPTTMVTIEADEKPLEFVPVGKVKKTTEPAAALVVEEPAAEPDKEPADVKPEIKPADIVAFPANKDKIKPSVLEYPHEVEGGIYGDTFVNVDSETVLKLRTLVVKDIYLL